LVDWQFVVSRIAGPSEIVWQLIAQDLGLYEYELSTLELRLKSAAANDRPVKVSRALSTLLLRR